MVRLGSSVGRLAFGLLLSGIAGGIGACTNCGDSYPAGTRFRVIVREAFDGCHVTFDKGQRYDLVAGPEVEEEEGDGASCETNFATGLPGFTTSEFELKGCTGGRGLMSASCAVELPACVNSPGGPSGLLETQYSALPEESGETVAANLRLKFAPLGSCSLDSCDASIPVFVSW